MIGLLVYWIAVIALVVVVARRIWPPRRKRSLTARRRTRSEEMDRKIQAMERRRRLQR